MKFFSFPEKVATIQNEVELRSYFMDVAGGLVGANAWGLDLLDSHFNVITSDLSGLPDIFRVHYQELGIDADPISQMMLQHHIPAHNLSMHTPQAWKQSKLHKCLFQRYGIEHGMVAPLVGNGQLIGGIYFLRFRDLLPFSDADLIYLTSLTQYLSVRLAILRVPSLVTKSSVANCLRERELEIADLVAQGLSNREIGIKLNISCESVKQVLKRMFQKLNVSARAEMVAKLKS